MKIKKVEEKLNERINYKVIDVKFSEYGNRSILDVLREMNIDITADCAGKGTCRKCKVGIAINRSEYKKDLGPDKVDIVEVIACKHRIFKDISLYVRESYLNNNDYKIGNESNTNISDISSIDFCSNSNSINYSGGQNYGVAIDIGTTTIELGIIDISSKKEVIRRRLINPQKKYGQDVFSRIEFSQKEDGNLSILKKELISSINAELESLDKGLREGISKIIISANCTLTHLFLGEEVESLGKYPYKPMVINHVIKKSEDLGLCIKGIDVITLPQISAFVGGDIVSGAHLLYKKIGINERNIDFSNNSVLFVDIGTNGELILFHNGKKYATSCAAGPALEGMNISCGTIARVGAVESVDMV